MIITFKGKTTVSKEFDAPVLLSDALRQAGFEFDMPCGGRQRCGKCAVRAKGALSEISKTEKQYLNGYPEDTRLACFASALGNCTVFFNEASALISTDGISLDISPDGDASGIGFAVDIGTTTVAVYAYELKSGKELCRDAFLNPQKSFGADVISRIDSALKGNAEQLSHLLVESLSASFSRLCQKCSIPSDKVTSAVITGNTAMLYLLLKQDVTPLSHAPFETTEHLGKGFKASDIGIAGFENMQVSIPPAVSAFVGSDITCSMLSSFEKFTPTTSTALMIDIGTNGEMVLISGESIICCSTAAGPAFEGAGITNGCLANEGAINSVGVENGEIIFSVIGGGEPHGICGSGLIDAIAVFLKLGLIDETGCINEESPYSQYITEHDGSPALKIGNSDIIITGGDIRAVQLAKSAICAGIFTLIHAFGIEEKDIEQLILAGGFGSFINTESAAGIGLIPDSLKSKAVAAGNAAGMGASAILLSKEAKNRAEDLAARAKTADLSTDPYFMEKYIECMMF